MKSWKRITLVISILIGSSAFFAYWANNQFNQAFDNLGDSYLANTPTVSSSSSSFKKDAARTSASPQISEEFSTPTDPL